MTKDNVLVMNEEKVYIVILEPRGDLACDCSIEILGVFKTEEQAREKAIMEIKEDIRCNDYVVREEDLNDFRRFITVFYKVIENWNYYYNIHIEEKIVR